MRLLVVSDSHGYDEELEFVLKNITYDAAIHCGDCHFDKKSSFLKLFDVIVQGNHDEDFLPLEMTFKTPLGEIFICHGHTFHVYKGYDELSRYINKKNISICFHGHTHVPHIEKFENSLFVNPGSIMFNRGLSECGSYAIVEINHKIEVTFYDSRTLKKIPQSVIDKDQDILNEFKLFAK